MAGPPDIPRAIFQGDNDPPLVWGFGPKDDPEDLTGAEFSLVVSWRDAASKAVASITATSSPADGLVVDRVAGTVSWFYSAADSGRIPRGKHARYKLTCIKGTTIRTRAHGELTVGSGLIG